jgi:hypothetical protein
MSKEGMMSLSVEIGGASGRVPHRDESEKRHEDTGPSGGRSGVVHVVSDINRG